jgi:hypothetical protein
MAAIFSFLVLTPSVNNLPDVFAQPQFRNVQQAQQRIRQRMIQEQGGGNRARVEFNNDTSFNAIDNNETRVTGSGVYRRNNNDPGRSFNYNAVFNIYNGNLRTLNYNFTGGGGSGGGGGGGGGRPEGSVMYSGPITNQRSGKVLDVSNQSTADGANIQQWDYANQSNQRWDVIRLRGGEVAIVNQLSGKVLDVQNGSFANGANVQQYYWGNVPNQRWRLQNAGGGWYRIVSVRSGKCLDVQARSQDNGANIHQWACTGQPNQRWRLRY